MISLASALFVGTSHLHILMSLTIDLSTLKCASQEDYEDVRRLKMFFNTSLIIWLVILVSALVFFFIYGEYRYIMLAEAVFFILQSI